jgi:hypothetical protein
MTSVTAKYAELVTLFATDPSEALYRAEEELSHDDFMTFIDFASNHNEPAIKPFDPAENDNRNAWLLSLNHEDVLVLIAKHGRCGHYCSSCDLSAFYILTTPDNGIDCSGIMCLRAATYWERLIEQDKAEGIRPEWQSTLTRVPTAAQRETAKQDIGWN